MSKFLEIHESQDFSNITPEQALEIMQDHLATYGAGERFKRSYQATRDALESIYGGKINKRKSSTGENKNVTSSPKTSYILKNDDVKEEEKFRYVRIQQSRNILKKNITKSAHHLWTALQMSPNSTSLGAYEITLRELQYQTISDNIQDVINDLNELQQQGELFYFNNVVYLTHFHENQKQHGNDKAIKGILNNYNSLKNNQKLPFISDFDTKNMTMQQLEESFFRLKKAIELMGKLYAGCEINRLEMLEIWTSEQVDSIVNGVLTLEESQPVEKVSLVVPQIIEKVIEPIEEPQQEEPQSLVTPQVVDPIEQQEDIQQMEITPQHEEEPQKLDDENIIKIIATSSNLTEDIISEYIIKVEFNDVYRYVHNGGQDFNKIKEMTIDSFSKLRN